MDCSLTRSFVVYNKYGYRSDCCTKEYGNHYTFRYGGMWNNECVGAVAHRSKLVLTRTL